MINFLLGVASHVDPMSLPIWATLLFAAGMYPIGFLMPCSGCCGCSDCPSGTKLPDTLTVTFSGLTDRTQGDLLCSLVFTSCFGSGATGRVTGPGGDPGVDDGPITGAVVTSGGIGYAKLGRVEPTIYASLPAISKNDPDVQLDVTLQKSQDSCGVDYWKVLSVSVPDGVSGYKDGSPVTFSTQEGDEAFVTAVAHATTLRSVPTLVVSGSRGGIDATLSASLSETTDDEARAAWKISSISIADGGTAYTEGETLSVILDDISESSPLSAYVSKVDEDGAISSIKINNGGLYYRSTGQIDTVVVAEGGAYYKGQEPTLSVSAPGGSGASMVATYSVHSESPQTWSVEGVEVLDGGSGYTDNSKLVFTPDADDSVVVAASGIIRTSRLQPSMSIDVDTSTGSGGSLSAVLIQTTDEESREAWTVGSVSIDAPGSGYSVGDAIHAAPVGGVVKGTFVAAVSNVDQDGAIQSVEIGSGGLYYQDSGIIETVVLAAGGEYYKALEPTLVASGVCGNGASLVVNYSVRSASPKTWRVSSVSVLNGGDGYEDSSPVVFSIGNENSFVGQEASAIVRTVREEPTVRLRTGAGGVGAVLSASYSKKTTTPDTWTVDSVSVSSGGHGYTNGLPVVFTLGKTDTLSGQSAAAIVTTEKAKPSLSFGVDSSSGGGATLCGSLTPAGDGDWSVAQISVASGGAGYSVGEWIYVAPGAFTESYPLEAYVSGVDANGEITSVTVNDGGLFFKDSGVIKSVEVLAGGDYYGSGDVTGVAVTTEGIYYREDPTATPYVANISVEVSQPTDGIGGGAVLSAVVNSTAGGPDFGRITGVLITDPGDNYLAWKWKNTKCCGWYWNDKPVVLKRAQELLPVYGNSKCIYSHRMCGGWNGVGHKGHVALEYRGPTTPPVIWLTTEFDGSYADESFWATECNSMFLADANVPDCASWGGVAFSQTSPQLAGENGFFVGTGNATATVSAGGEYNKGYKAGNCHSCCQGQQIETEVAVSVDDQSAAWLSQDPEFSALGGPLPPDFSGTYILSLADRGIPSLLTSVSSSGTGAVLSPSYVQLGSPPSTWAVESVSVVQGGSGYEDGESVTFSLGANDVLAGQAAKATIKADRIQPTLTATVTSTQSSFKPTLTATVENNSSATLPITYSSPVQSVWAVSSIAVASGGTGHVDGSKVVFILGQGDSAVAGDASASIRTARTTPTFSTSVASTGGSGAAFQVNVNQSADAEQRPVWSVASIAVTASGSGYSVNDQVLVTVTNGRATAASSFSAKVGSVSPSGGITSVAVGNGGWFYGDTGVISSVVVENGGGYRKEATGTGATLVVNSSQFVNAQSKNEWRVSGFTITNPGLWYAVGQDVLVTATQGVQVAAAVAQVASVSETGQIESISVINQGAYYKKGAIASVSVSQGGEYYKQLYPAPDWSVIVPNTETYDYVGVPPAFMNSPPVTTTYTIQPGSARQIRVWAERCDGDPCDGCIKKCKLRASLIPYFLPGTEQYPLVLVGGELDDRITCKGPCSQCVDAPLCEGLPQAEFYRVPLSVDYAPNCDDRLMTIKVQ